MRLVVAGAECRIAFNRRFGGLAGGVALVIIPKAQYNNAQAKIVLKPNFKTKHGKVLSVRSYGASEKHNLEDTIRINGVEQRRYKVLAGELWPKIKSRPKAALEDREVRYISSC